MTAFVALLRAVNVGGTGKLPMEELKRLCEKAGFKGVRTYIASGNVVLESDRTEAEVKTRLEKELAAYAGKPVGVLVRTAAEMAQVAAENPFREARPSFCVAIFLDGKPPKETLTTLKNQADEQVALGRREVYVHYGEGMGQSKLGIPAAKTGTARNMNTVAKLAEMAAELEGTGASPAAPAAKAKASPKKAKAAAPKAKPRKAKS